ncbi:MAG TPA: GNAT family N-acetyltransferase [Patescibacteria group bacterium]|jgi:RimJ/RimL family protein N-acetyltransferase|nr:GNAT family N-acetyltransferase [Patescibacteria group bacterium]
MTVNPPETLTTPRLLLRKPRLTDAESIFEEYARDPEATRYLLFRPHQDIGQTHEFLRTRLANWGGGDELMWGITVKPDDRLVGMIACRFNGHRVDIGYVIARRLWGNGYMSETVKAVGDWVLEQEGIHRVWAVCDTNNRASARVMEKAGMKREGLLKRWLVHPNISDEPRDCFVYSRVRGES